MGNEFEILPSTNSMMMEMTIVIILFLFYIVYISYISAYDSGFKPNYVMFINFLLDDYNGSKNFQTYINGIIVDKKNEKETFTIINKNFISDMISKYISYAKYNLNKLLSKSYIKGNKLTIIRSV